MRKNLLILRASPDWNTFDIECSRGFLRSLRLPEDLVVEFAALWDKHFKVDYRGVRAQLKTLALQTYDEVRQASLLRHEEWDDTGQPDGRVAFVDDDDWMSPSLFESLPATTPTGCLRLCPNACGRGGPGRPRCGGFPCAWALFLRQPDMPSRRSSGV